MTACDSVAIAADGILELSVVGSFTRLGPVARRRLFDWQPLNDLDGDGRVAVITGVTSGLGRAAAIQLVRTGATVVGIGRDADRTARACVDIATHGPGTATPVIADLASLEAVRAAAATLRDDHDRIDVLIHNAGAMAERLERTDDGIEVTAQTHVAAPFLLTTELLEPLRRSPDPRVITVSSGGMYTRRLDLATLVAADPDAFDGVRSYAVAKRAQVVLNELWATRFPEVGFHAMHPGWADTPGVASSLPRFHQLLGPALRSPEEGADTITWLATTAEPLPTGRFWLDRRPRTTVRLPGTGTSPGLARSLWDWCRNVTGAEPAPTRPTIEQRGR